MFNAIDKIYTQRLLRGVYMNFKRMEVLSAINKFGNISKAAKYLNLKQPTVSFHMKNLEDDVKATLFNNHNNKIFLTEEGKALLFYAQKILNLSNDAKTTMKYITSVEGYEIKIGSSSVPALHILPDILTLYKKSKPNFLAKISVSVATAPEIQKMLKNYEISFGIVSSSDIFLEGINSRKLCTDKMVLAFSPDHHLRYKNDITKEDLKDQSFILHSINSSTRKLTNKWAEDIGLDIKPYLEISSVETIIKSLRKNLGISVLSEISVREAVKEGHLLTRELPSYSPSRNIYIIYNVDRYMPSVLKEFIDLLIKSYGSNQ